MIKLRRLVPKSLAGQLIAILLLALVGGHVLTLIIFSDERREVVEETNRRQALTRIVAVVRLLNATPENLHERVIDSASTPLLQFSLGQQPVEQIIAAHRRDAKMANALAARLGPLAEAVMVQSRDRDFLGRWWRKDREEDDHDTHSNMRESMHPLRNPDLQLSIKTANGIWLNVGTAIATYRPDWAIHTLMALVISSLVVIVIVGLAVRRMTRPLRKLAIAAEGLGRGEAVSDLPVEGPDDMRRTVDAFNRMRTRLERYVTDRTNMLAAVSHDLKTPITALRLRAEFIEDTELQEKIIKTLDDMQAITESTLNFVREDAEREETRPIDLGALLESISEDMRDRGDQVDVTPPDRIVLSCRPASLKRALVNVLENAIAYGQKAQVSCTVDGAMDSATISIDDNGPGIPPEDQERVFEPFFRLESSRNRETGGTGLGLAIARSIVRGHGGEIILMNRSTGGLRVMVHLPGVLR